MIYIHIPFCKQKCSYCNFHFSTSLNFKDEMLHAMKTELMLRKNELQNQSLKSLYFGGGTPSILSVDEINSMIDEVLRYFSFEKDIEITLEANPDDLDKNFLKQLSGTPVNRLSIGTQSFFEEDLKLMNRAHNASEAESSIKRAQDFGFENLSIDLIYGSPTSNLEIWKENLHKTIALEVPHISSYALTVEPKTALENWISKGKVKSPREEEQNKEFYYLSDFLKDNGFEHYEVSNFARPGFYSRHNSAYWKYQEYLGIGPSAHSYNGFDVRSWNVANNQQYIKKLAGKILAKEEEILSQEDQFNEMIMIGLRTIWGVDITSLTAKFPERLLEHFQTEIKSKIDEGILIIENDHLKIPEKHWFMADGIASDIFIV
ncbi:radical SAM family heme chaperone HemW [Chryseobacterium indologenes]|uniref:Heme chaperone HemW n=2 Tax=Chryseobacterium indologenes TaxID=253 RepID=A0AAD0YYK1_CHRID|nr:MULTISPECIES: radical SAM family heme chaperone HemW [Chryseobacterium]ATN03967.1 coproporphyrinogen III oxidase [Chryseobacterium indologenes]AYY83368.1 radical SAM family heme chaperone HemW [Chryseobacterium indologenes]AYZ37177.1 radical SAM family heme chaperone HemW [Chryseobacterium indologenes]AZB19682.1 radical SAM family heme chaperone HemW [Chryseobacterium indologenes]MBF6646031.1 radical SAM family heme chaperone HemW [Chryseobacterium indologenes]